MLSKTESPGDAHIETDEQRYSQTGSEFRVRNIKGCAMLLDKQAESDFHKQGWRYHHNGEAIMIYMSFRGQLLAFCCFGDCTARRIIWAMSRENLSSGFATSVDSNRHVQSQNLGYSGLKFRIWKIEVLYYPGNKQQWPDQTAWRCRLICAFVVRIWHKQVFSWCGSYTMMHVFCMPFITENPILLQNQK